MKKGGSIYILTNKNNSVLYVGVTEDLIRRVQEYKSKFHPTSFSAKYNLDKLVYFENYHSIDEAINREKQIKGSSRANKESLINALNPNWEDLFDELIRN